MTRNKPFLILIVVYNVDVALTGSYDGCVGLDADSNGPETTQEIKSLTYTILTLPLVRDYLRAVHHNSINFMFADHMRYLFYSVNGTSSVWYYVEKPNRT